MKKIPQEDVSLSAAWIGLCFFMFIGVLFLAYWFGYSIDETAIEMNIRLHPISLIVLTLIPIIATIGGILLIKGTVYRIPIILLILLGTGFSSLFLSDIYINKVQITPEYINETTGTYFSTSTRGFQLVDIQSITIDWHTDSRATNRVWIIEHKNKKQEQLEPSPAWEYNEAEIVQKLQQFGVTIYRN